MFPAWRSVRTFQVPKRISIFVSLFRNLGRFHEDSPVSITEFFATFLCFTGQGCQPCAQPPTWRARVSLFVWVITLDQSGMGGMQYFKLVNSNFVQTVIQWFIISRFRRVDTHTPPHLKKWFGRGDSQPSWRDIVYALHV
jgi:hypothetical protein